MKKLILIAYLLSLPIAMYSQPFGEAAPSWQITALLYENSSGEKATTLFRYDPRNRLFRALWSLDDQSRNSVNYYEYDADGNLVSAFRDFSDGLTSFERFEYDSVGNKTAEYFRRSDSVSGSASYTYDGNQLVQARFNRHKGWLSGTLDLQYNALQQRVQGILKDEGSIVCEISYEYDSAGNLAMESWNFNNDWDQTFHYVYSKNNQTKRFYSSPYLSTKSPYRISLEHYTYNNELGGPSAYDYNEDGLLRRKVFTRSDGLTTNTFYHYDKEGRLETSERYYPDSSTALFTYDYDEQNNLVQRSFFRADTLFGFESYLYSADGDLMKAYLKRFDGWLSGTVDYETDALGKVVRGTFLGEDGFNAAIEFNYNRENLVSEITWNFPDGTFQQYRFEYEQLTP